MDSALYKRDLAYQPEKAGSMIDVEVDLEVTHTMGPGMKGMWRSLLNPEANMLSWERAVGEVITDDIVNSGLFKHVQLHLASAADSPDQAPGINNKVDDAHGPIYSSEYALAQQAEASGRYRKALNHYINELQMHPQQSGYRVKVNSWEELKDERTEYKLTLTVSEPSARRVIRVYEKGSSLSISPFSFTKKYRDVVRNILAEIKTELVADYKSGRLRNPGQERALRKRIIRVVQKVEPRPAFPEQSEVHMIQGLLTLANATSKEGLKSAADEFEHAIFGSPWYGPAYMNLAAVQISLGEFDQATGNAELFLQTSPSAAMRRKAQEMLNSIQRKQREAREEQRRLAILEKFKQIYGGHAYQGISCISKYVKHPEYPEAKVGLGCNYDEYKGNYWKRWDVYSFAYYEFYFTKNSEVVLRFVSDGIASSPTLIGRPKGPELSDIEWKCAGKDQVAWVRILEEKGSIIASCDRPNISWNNPRLDQAKRYGYK